MSNNSKFSTVTTQQVLFPTNSGSIKINTDDSGKVFIGALSAPGNGNTLIVDPIQNEIVTSKIRFSDGTFFDTAVDFSNINSSNSAVSSYFDENGKLRENNAPTDYSEIRTKATNGNNAFNKFSGSGGKLPIDSVIPPGSYTGWGEINTDLARGISADNDLSGLNFDIDNSDPNNPIVKINKGGSRGFTTTTIGKSSIGLGNVANESPATIRSGITIVNGVLNGIGTSGIVVNNASIGLSRDPTSGEITLEKGVGTPVTVNPFTATRFTDVSSSADSAKTTANTVRGFFTDIPNQIPQLNLTYLPIISESKLSSVVTTKLAYANTINGYFTAGKLNEANAADSLKNSNVTKASIGLPNVEDVSPTQIREGIGLSVDSTTGQISITRSGTTTLTVNSLSSTEFTSTKTNASNALTNAALAQSTANSANTTATTVRNFFDTETIPQLKDSNTPAGLKNSNVSLSLSGQTFTFNNGTAQDIPISKDNVGLNQVANESPSTIRSGITVINGVLTGIGTSNIVVDNSSINLTRDETTGEITLNKGIGSPITIDPFSATRFTTLSGTVNNTNTLANDIDNRFINGILKESNAADSLKNSNVFSDSRFIEVSGTANTALQNANTGIENAATAQSTADTVSGYFSFGVIKSSSLPANLKQTNITVSNANLDISNSTYYSNLFIRDGRTLNSSITLTIPFPSNCTGCRLIIYRGTNTLIKNSITIRCILTGNYFIAGTSVSSTIPFSPDSQTKPLELYSNGAQWFVVS
jgi:hypothetical protein